MFTGHDGITGLCVYVCVWGGGRNSVSTGQTDLCSDWTSRGRLCVARGVYAHLREITPASLQVQQSLLITKLEGITLLFIIINVHYIWVLRCNDFSAQSFVVFEVLTKLHKMYYKYCSIRLFLTTSLPLSLYLCLSLCMLYMCVVSERSSQCWIQT